MQRYNWPGFQLIQVSGCFCFSKTSVCLYLCLIQFSFFWFWFSGAAADEEFERLFLELIGRGEAATPPASETVIKQIPRVPISKVWTHFSSIFFCHFGFLGYSEALLGEAISRYSPFLRFSPPFPFTLQEMVSAKDQCPVCLDFFRAEDPPVMRLRCKHTFHEECLLPWLKKTATCPGQCDSLESISMALILYTCIQVRTYLSISISVSHGLAHGRPSI